MIFPITELLDEQESLAVGRETLSPQRTALPRLWSVTREEAREFRQHKRGFVDYRCHHCQRTYNLYTGTLFAGSNLDAAPCGVVSPRDLQRRTGDGVS